MRVVLSHPTGNENVRAVGRAMAQAGTLDSFWTSIAFPDNQHFLDWIPTRVARELQRRVFPGIPFEKIRTSPVEELLRQLGSWNARVKSILGRAELGTTDSVYAALDEEVAAYLGSKAGRGVDAVYCYEDGAATTFSAAGRHGVRRIYDLPIPYWRHVHRSLREEQQLHPAWAATLSGLSDKAAKLARKDREIQTADLIVVASSFTQSTLAEFWPELETPVVVRPYGAPSLCVREPSQRKPGDPLRIVSVGHLTAAKGIHYVLQTVRRLDIPWTLTLAGALPAEQPAELKRALGDSRIEYLGHVPHHALMALLPKAHVLVSASLYEGFGLVITEAMSAGLPVIATERSGAPDVLEDSKEGFITPVRAPERVAELLVGLFENESERRRMARDARRKANQLSWSSYELEIRRLVECAS